MKFVLRRASNDYWYKIVEIKDLQDLLKFYRMNDDLIISQNNWKNTDPIEIMHVLYIDDIEIAKEISKLDYSIKIYDDYIE